MSLHDPNRLAATFLLVSALVTPPFASSGDQLVPAVETEAVAHDADDPAIWLNALEPGKSLILATDKIAGEGGLYVFGLDGRLRQRVASLDRPNNVDVEYGVLVDGRRLDIAVVTERKQHRLRVFGIPAEGTPLIDLAPNGLAVLAGLSGEAAEPMGIGLFKRPRDGAVFAIVAPKTGGASEYLWQYRLSFDGAPTATLVRRFGQFSGRALDGAGEIEAVAVDDALGYVYYSDERHGIRKWAADPDAADAGAELAVIGTDGYDGDREGLAIYSQPNGTGFLVSSDQVPGSTRLHVYPREGSPNDPHRQNRLAIIATSADATDGLDATSTPVPGFPDGLVVMMNSSGRNFQLYRWSDLSRQLTTP